MTNASFQWKNSLEILNIHFYRLGFLVFSGIFYNLDVIKWYIVLLCHTLIYFLRWVCRVQLAPFENFILLRRLPIRLLRLIFFEFEWNAVSRAQLSISVLKTLLNFLKTLLIHFRGSIQSYHSTLIDLLIVQWSSKLRPKNALALRARHYWEVFIPWRSECFSLLRLVRCHCVSHL